MAKLRNLLGQRFGRLVVIRKGIKTSHCAYWVCKCDCGNEKEIRGRSMWEGATKSCGCLNAETRYKYGLKQITHGLSHHPLYHTWSKMLERCYNKKHIAYHSYGGRGIKVCERWHNLTNFVKDLGEKPLGHSLDRINNDGDYCPENCQWATAKEQSKNRRFPPSIYDHEQLKRRVAQLETEVEHLQALVDSKRIEAF